MLEYRSCTRDGFFFDLHFVADGRPLKARISATGGPHIIGPAPRPLHEALRDWAHKDGDRPLYELRVILRRDTAPVREALRDAGVPEEALELWEGERLVLYVDSAGGTAEELLAKSKARNFAIDLGCWYGTIERSKGLALVEWLRANDIQFDPN